MAGLSEFAPPFSSAMPAAELSSQVTTTRTTALIDPVLLEERCYICKDDIIEGHGQMKSWKEDVGCLWLAWGGVGVLVLGVKSRACTEDRMRLLVPGSPVPLADLTRVVLLMVVACIFWFQ